MDVTAVEALFQVAGDVQRGGSGGGLLLDRRRLRVHLRGPDARDDEARLGETPAAVGPDLGEYTLTDLLGSIFDLTHRQLSEQRPA
ncbi:hypothetical protein [Streptomyces sp. NPDC093568]|uniref:hypothetical protein n=1 Tax=Streptomyces sp. NPDC093568 TaxID=3366041 RepID=UPI003825C6B5